MGCAAGQDCSDAMPIEIYCDNLEVCLSVSRRIILCLVTLYSAELEHEAACDYIRNASENLGVKILPRRRRPSKFQCNALRYCAMLSARAIIRQVGKKTITYPLLEL